MVKVILRVIDWLLFTSLFTACCATGLCMATERLINGHPPRLTNPLHILVFGSTLLVYNSPRIFKKRYHREIYTSRLPDRYRVWYFVFFALGFSMVILSLSWLSRQIFLACLVLGVLAFAYSLPLLPFRNKKRLRDFGWIKIFVLASVWTIVTSVLPILYWHKTLSLYPFEIVLRMVLIFTLCIVFDIRDMQADLNNNIHTLPQKVGIKNSYRLINITLCLFALLSVVQYMRFPVIERLAGALFTALITKLVVSYLQKHPTERAYLGLADGVMLLYALLVLLP
jgi:4-hydroxybenzoate polyprenyltransferase